MDQKKKILPAFLSQVFLCLAAAAVITVLLAATVLRPLFYTKDFPDAALKITNLGIQDPQSDEEEPGTEVEVKTIQGADCSEIPETEGWYVDGSWIVGGRTQVPSSISIPAENCRYIMAIFVRKPSSGKIQIQVGGQKEELDLFSPGYETVMWNYQPPQKWSLRENPQDVAALYVLCAAILLGAYFFWKRSRDAAVTFQSLYHFGFFVIFGILTIEIIKKRAGGSPVFYPILALCLAVHLVFGFWCGKMGGDAVAEAGGPGKRGKVFRKPPLDIYNLCFGIGLCIMAAAQVYVGKQLAVDPSWDFGNVYYGAKELIENGKLSQYNNCFLQCPNNMFALVLLACVFRIVSLFHEVTIFAGIWFNVFMIDLAVVLLYLWMRMVWGAKKALYGFVVCLFLCPYYLYVPVFYTDTLSLPFTAGILWLSGWAKRKEGTKAGLALYGVLGAFCAAGYLLKGSLAVFAAAIVIYTLLRKNVKKKVFCLFAMAAGAAFFLSAWKIGISASGIIDDTNRESLEFDAPVYFMMGMGTGGAWSAEDHVLAGSVGSIAERNQVCFQMLENRVRAMGFYGAEKHFIRKGVNSTWGDGLYFTYEKLRREPLGESWLHDYVLESGSHFSEVSVWASGYHIGMLLLMLVSIFSGIWTRQTDEMALVRLMVMGLMLFLFLWETRSRYLVNATPLFVVMAADGSTKLAEAARKVSSIALRK